MNYHRSASTDGIKPSRPVLPPLTSEDLFSGDDAILKRAFSTSYLYEITNPNTSREVPTTAETILCPSPRKSFPDITVLNDRRIPLSMSMSSMNLSIRLHGIGTDREKLVPALEATRTKFYVPEDDDDSEDLFAFNSFNIPIRTTSPALSQKSVKRFSTLNVNRVDQIELSVTSPFVKDKEDVKLKLIEQSSTTSPEKSPLAEACVELHEIVNSTPAFDFNNEEIVAHWLKNGLSITA
ncbi:hypothetical protein HK096_003208 [Nowakowskiella sp. JEL0078]|nr:hypothetical protein HK096_003208 [Nowakowskiella sp. JEL0078]